MKKSKHIYIIVATAIACSDKPVNKPTPKSKPDIVEDNPKVTVTFNTNGGSDIATKKVPIGKTIAKPDATHKKGFHLVGWYKDENRTIPFKFDTNKITQNITLYADWILKRTISAGAWHVLYIDNDGALWAWGFNKYGLGFGDTDGRSSPTQIGTDTWRWVDTGTHHTVGVKTDGTLWTWGYNTQGQLGFEDITNRSSSTQVGSDTWRMASAGHDHTVGIKTDGTLQLLGENRRGITAPVVKGKWRMVDAGEYHVIGIKEDGTLWAWGWNWQGQLGIGNTTDQNSFTQIGSDTWQMVNGGQEYSSCGIKNDGTPWTWGSNRFGQLGIGNTANQNAPVQVTFL